MAGAAIFAAGAGLVHAAWLAESVQEEDAVLVTFDPQSRDTTYSSVRGTCRISWIAPGSEIDRGVIRQRSQCTLPLPEQIPLISNVLRKVLESAPGAGTPRTLFWGRLSPDGPHDSVLSMRLAAAAKRSREWDAIRGRPRTGNENTAVRKLANEAAIYAELREMFREAGLDIQVAYVEKVLVVAAGKLPFLDQLSASGVKAADRLPYDCMAWFSISKLVGPRVP